MMIAIVPCQTECGPGDPLLAILFVVILCAAFVGVLAFVLLRSDDEGPSRLGRLLAKLRRQPPR
jgi:hypothetical protein